MPGKRVQIDEEMWTSLDMLAKDCMMTFQELADEAFRDLLKKHGRPVSLKEALRRSAGKVGRGRTLPRRAQEAALARPGWRPEEREFAVLHPSLARASGALVVRARPSRHAAPRSSGRAPSCTAILSTSLSSASNFFYSKFLVLLLTICEAISKIVLGHRLRRGEMGNLSGRYGRS